MKIHTETKTCANETCGKHFPIDWRDSRRLYCSARCARTVNVRRRRVRRNAALSFGYQDTAYMDRFLQARLRA